MGRDLLEPEAQGFVAPRWKWWSKLERAVGAFLVAASGVGLVVWLIFLLNAVQGGVGRALRVAGYPIPAPLGMILLTLVVLGLAGTQGLLGIGLLKQRPWVTWFGVLYVLGGTLGAGLAKVLPTGDLFFFAALALGTLPTWIFVRRWVRGDLGVWEDR